MAENNGSLAEVQLTVAVDKKKYFNQLKKVFQDSQTECDANALTIKFQKDRASIENILQELSKQDFSANVTLESNVEELTGHLKDVLAHMDATVPITADTSELDKKLAEEKKKLEEMKKSQLKSADDYKKQMQKLAKETASTSDAKSKKASIDLLKTYELFKKVGGRFAANDSELKETIAWAQKIKAFAKQASENPIKVFSTEDIEQQIQLVNKLEQEIKEAKAAAKGGTGTGTGTGTGNAKIDTEPEVDPAKFAEKVTEQLTTPAEIKVDGVVPNADEFANKVSEQLTSPAQIKVDGVVSNAQEFADNVSKQLTVPVNVEVTATNSQSSSAKTEEIIDPKLQEKINSYQRAIKNLEKYVKLQKEVAKANPAILPGYLGMKQVDLLYGGDLHRDGTPTKTSIKKKLDEYLNNNSQRNFDVLAAYVNALKDTEAAEKIFGKSHADLFKQVMDYIDQAKLSLDAYKNAEIALSAGRWNLKDAGLEKMTLGMSNKLENILKSDGVEAAIEYLKKELGFEIPQAVERTTSAIHEASGSSNTNFYETLKRENEIRDASNNVLKEFNASLKDTAAYLYDVNNQEERMIMLQGKMQVGDTLVQGNGHVGVSYDTIDALKPDTLAHSHQYDKVFNNLRFSTDDIAKATARDFINRLVLSCGKEMLEFDFAGIDPQQREQMVRQMSETYTSVFALYGAAVKEDGTLGNPKESLDPKVYNEAVDVINSMMYEIAQSYGANFAKYNAADFGNEAKIIPFKPVSSTISKYISSMGLALGDNNTTGIAKLQADFAEETARATKKAASGIDAEAKAAKDAIKWKKEFAKANKLVAESAEKTAEETKEAADGIATEEDASEKATDSTKSFKSNPDLLRYLKDIQKGTNTIPFSIAIDKEMAEAELKRVAPDIADAFNKQYGTNITGSQVIKAYKSALKGQQAAEEDALQSHLEAMEKRTQVDEAYNEALREQIHTWADYIQQTEEARNAAEEQRQIDAYSSTMADAMAYANQQAAEELEYQQKLAIYKEYGAEQIREIIEEEKEQAAWVEEVCKKQEESNALLQRQLDEAEQLAVYDMAMEYANQQAAEEAEYLKKRNEYLAYGKQQQEEYLQQAREIGKAFDDADKVQETTRTQQNKEAAKAYNKLYQSAKEYYSLLLESEKGPLSSNKQARLDYLSTEWKDASDAVGKYAIEVDGATDSINRATEARAKFNQEAQNTSVNSELKDLQSSYDKIQGMMGSGKYTATFIVELSKIQSQIRDVMNTPIDLDDANMRHTLVSLHDKIDETIGRKAFSDVKKAASSSLSKLELQINEFTTQNTGMGLKFRQQFENLRIRLTDAKSIADVEKLAGSITKLKSEVESAGKATRSFFDILKERIVGLNAQAIAQYFSWQDWIRYIRQMATTVTELDTALTEMRKVSDDSLTSLQAYQKTTFDTADAVGTTALALQKSTADWMRLGEAQKQAAESAKAATVLMNVSEFESIDEATQALVSVSQTYQDIDKMDIIDVINNIGNNYSVATDELAQGLQNAAAVLKTQGNDLNEAVALLTAGNAITQDISKTSAGIRTISLRIAGTQEAKDQLADLGEEVDDFIVQTESKTQKLIKDYTAVASNAYKGVDVLDANGNLRNTYDILLDIARIYKEIQAEDKKAGTNRAQALVEYIAGKNRSNIAASMLLNPEMLENVYNSALDSTGSAERELSKYLESIEGHIAKFQTQLQELEFDALDSDTIKTFIDLGTGALSVIDSIVDSLGVLGTLGTAAAIAAATQNFGVFKTTLDATSESGLRITSVFNELANALNDSQQFEFSASYTQSISDAEKAFKAYTDDVDAGIDPQVAFNHVLETGDDALIEYVAQYGASTEAQNNFLNGQAKAQVALMAENTSLTNVSSLIQGYNKSLELTGLEQKEFAAAVMSTNGSLGQYLINLGNAEATMGGYLAYVIKTTAATIAMRAATMALNAVIGMAVSWLISKAIQAWDDYIHRVDNAKKALEEFEDKCKGLQTDLKKQSDTVNNLSDSYFELAKGVDAATGKNISLSNEDYEEFVSTNQELAEMFPQLIRGVDEYGNYILDLGTNADTARKKLQELLEQEQDNYNYELYKDLPDVLKNTTVLVDSANEKIDNAEESLRTYDLILKTMDKISNMSEDELSLSAKLGDNEATSFIYNFVRDYQDMVETVALTNEDLASKMRAALTDESVGEDVVKVFRFDKLSADEKQAIADYFQEYSDELKSRYATSIAEAKAELQQGQTELNSAWLTLQKNIVGGINFLSEDDKTTEALTRFVNSLPAEIAESLKDTDIQSEIANWVSDLGELKPEDKLRFYNLFDPELTPQERINLYNELQGNLPEGFDIPIHYVIDEDRGLLDRVEQTKKELTTKDGQMVDVHGVYEFFDKEQIDTAEEYNRWLEAYAKAGGDAVKTMRLYREETEKAETATENLFSAAKFTEIDDELEDLQSLYESFRNNIENGKLKVPLDISDVEALPDAFKELDEFKDFELTVTTSTDIDEVQKKFNDFVTAYAKKQIEIKGLTKDTMDFVKAQMKLDGLESEGVDKFVDSLAAEEKMQSFVSTLEDAQDAEGNMADGAVDAAADIYEEAKALGITDDMLIDYLREAALAGNIVLGGDTSWLDKLAEKLGIDIKLLRELLGLANQGSGYATRVDSEGNTHITSIYGGKEAEDSNRRQKEKAEQQKNEKKYRDLSYLPTTKDASDAGSSAADSYVEAFEKELEALEKQRDAGIISETEFLEKYKALIEKYFKDVDGYGEEYAERMADYWDRAISHMENVVSAIGTLLDKKISAAEKSKDAAVSALEAEKEAALAAYDAQLEAIDELIEAKQAEIDAVQDEIDKLQEEHDARQRNIDLQKAQYNLQKAQNQRVRRVYKNGQLVYDNDPSAIREAKEQVDEAEYEIAIAALEKQKSLLEDQLDLLQEQRDAIEKAREAAEKYYDDLISQTEKYWDSIIEALENQKSKWEELVEQKEIAEAFALVQEAMEQLGFTVDDVLNDTPGAFEAFRDAYLSTLTEANAKNQDFLDGLNYATDGVSKALSSISEDAGGAADSLSSIGDATETVSNAAKALEQVATQSGTAASNTSDFASSLSDISESAPGVAQGVGDAAASIEKEGKAAQEAAPHKEAFAKANESIAENAGTVATNVSAAADAIGAEGTNAETAYQALDKLSKVELTPLVEQTSDLANAIGDVAKALGVGEDATVSSLETAITNLSTMSLGDESTGVIGSFNALKEAVSGVTTAIGGGGGGTSEGEDTESQGTGMNTDSGQGAGASNLTGAIESVKSATATSIGEDAEDDSGATAISDFNMLKEAVKQVCEKIGVSGESGEAAEDSLLGIITKLPELAEPALIGDGGLKSMFDELCESIAACASQALILQGAIQAMGSAGGMFFGQLPTPTATGNVHIGNAYASGKLGIKQPGDSLVGEAGQELIVDSSTGKYRLTNGPEITRLDKGDLVFNAAQTKAIIAHGMKDSGRSYAEGTGALLPLTAEEKKMFKTMGDALMGIRTDMSTIVEPVKSMAQKVTNNTTNIAPVINVTDTHFTVQGVTGEAVTKQISDVFSGIIANAYQRAMT